MVQVFAFKCFTSLIIFVKFNLHNVTEKHGGFTQLKNYFLRFRFVSTYVKQLLVPVECGSNFMNIVLFSSEPINKIKPNISIHRVMKPHNVGFLLSTEANERLLQLTDSRQKLINSLKLIDSSS